MADLVICEKTDLVTIADAIREKGGTSDNLAFPTAMAEAIKAIEAGGGSAGAHGSITFASETKTVKVTHNLGVIPDFFVLIPYAMSSVSIKSTYIAMVETDLTAVYYAYASSSPSLFQTRDSGATVSASDTDIEVVLSISKFLKPSTYHWCAIGG